MRKYLPICITTLSGILILAGYYFQVRSGGVLAVLIQWAVLLISTAALIGIGYLMMSHINRLLKQKKGRLESVILLVSFMATLIMGFVYSLDSEVFRDLVLHIQIPVEVSLLAVLSVVLFSSSSRLIKVRGWVPLSFSFLFGALVFHFLDLGWLRADSNTLAAVLLNLIQRLPVAGARGILLGIALGGLMVGLRVLLAKNRPFGEGK